MSNLLKDHLDEIKAVLQEDFGDFRSDPWMEPHNKLAHGLRTAVIAETLRQNICPDDPSVDPTILMVASWFHDIRNSRSDDHEKEGAEVIPSLIGKYGSEEEIRSVCEIVRYHDHRTLEDEKKYSTTIKLVQDADRLDHLGTFDIRANFFGICYCREPIEEFTKSYENGAFDHWAKEERKELNFAFSKEVYDEKIEFQRQFGLRMIREMRGELC